MALRFRARHALLLLCLFGIAAWVAPRAAAAQASPRERASLDVGWRFLQSDADHAEAIDFDDSMWSAVTLPHDWSIFGPFDRQAPAQRYGAFLPTGIGWYRHRLNVPAASRGKHVSLEFDGVYEYSEVWINGHSLGTRPYGFIGFGYDVTPYVNYGGENVIAVRVDNSRQTNCRWYSGSGIYRDVWLVTADPLRVAQWGTYVTTPSITESSATVNVVTRIANATAELPSVDYLFTILNSDGKPLASAKGSASVPANGNAEVASELTLPNPKRWSIESPNLYTLRIELARAGAVVDRYDTRFGVRDIQFDVDAGFSLNGKHVKLNGVCLHGDGGAVGTAVPIGIWKRRLSILKEMGCNAIRCSHNPPDPGFLDLCDEMGFCVMDEAFDEWAVEKQQVKNGYHTLFKEWHDRDATDFLRRDRNHPCIVIWSAGNEIQDQLFPGGTATVRQLVELFHKLDPTRPVTAACDFVYAEPDSAPPDFLAALDVVGYNYVDRWNTRAYLYYGIDRHDHPQRKMIGTENSSMGSVRGQYNPFGSANASTRQASTRPATRPARGASPKVNVEDLWKFTDEHDYVAGDFMWTGIDYLGESGVGSNAGVIDTAGFKKDGFYFYQSRWTDKPMVHAFPHWNWAGHEGQVLPVYAYTNCDTVELFVNDKSYGVKGFGSKLDGFHERWGTGARATRLRTTGDLHLSWDVAYEPGTLKLVGRTNGNVVATDEIRTAGAPAKIVVEADRQALAADGRDVAHVTVKVVDADGVFVPNADIELTFDVVGAATLIGVDSGSLSIDEPFKANKRRAFNGLALGIVQATTAAGTATVTVHAAGLPDATVDLVAK